MVQKGPGKFFIDRR